MLSLPIQRFGASPAAHRQSPSLSPSFIAADRTLEASPASAREAAALELTALCRSLPLPDTGKVVSDLRAQRAVLSLLGSLRGDVLNLSSVPSTVRRLLESGGDRIMPILDAVCESETDHGIATVHLNGGLTALMQSESPNWLLGLGALKNLNKLSLAPRPGNLDTRLLPLARSFVLNFDDPNSTVEILAYRGQNIEGTWPAKQSAPHIVHRFCMQSEDFVESMPLAGQVKPSFTLLPHPGCAVAPSAKAVREPTAPLDVLGLLHQQQGEPPRAAHAAPASRPTPAASERVVKLIDPVYPHTACWLKVTDAGEIHAAFLEATDDEPSAQTTYRIVVPIAKFEADLGEWMEMPGVALPGLLDALSAKTTDLEGFALWLHGEFQLSKDTAIERSLARP